MKAIEAMLFLLLLNVSFTIVNGLHIFTLVTGDFVGFYDISTFGSGDTFILSWVAPIFATLIAGAVGGAVTGILGIRISAPTAALYSAFGLLLTTLFVNSVGILYSLVSSIPGWLQVGVAMIVIVFLFVTGVMFLLGLMQLIGGSIKSSM